MRARFAILCGVLLFSIMVPTTAHAGSWSAFVAWLSDLDPKSGGIGIEMRLFCPGATGAAVPNVSAEFACDPDMEQKLVIKASAAILLGTLNDNLPQFISMGPIFESQCAGGVDSSYLGPEHAGVILKVDPAKAKHGRAKADETLCTMCHLGGFAGQNEIPRVAGQHYEYVVKQLRDFKDKKRTNDAGNMTSVSRTLNDADIENLGHYLAGL